MSNITAIIQKIRNERDIYPSDKGYKEIMDELDGVMDRAKELDPRLAKAIDEATGKYAGYLSSTEYTRGIRDCLRVMAALLIGA